MPQTATLSPTHERTDVFVIAVDAARAAKAAQRIAARAAGRAAAAARRHEAKQREDEDARAAFAAKDRKVALSAARAASFAADCAATKCAAEKEKAKFSHATSVRRKRLTAAHPLSYENFTLEEGLRKAGQDPEDQMAFLEDAAAAREYAAQQHDWEKGPDCRDDESDWDCD